MRIEHNRIKYTIISIITIMTIIGIIFIKIGLDYEKNISSIYNYEIQKKDDYEVILKPNIFYTTPQLPSGGYYASKSINNFRINFSYNLKADKKADIKYKYNVIAKLVGTVKNSDNQEKEIWTRDFILLEDKENQQTNVDAFSINEQVNIDYEYYNNLARSYEKTYKITIDTVLKVCLNASQNINISNIKTQNGIEDNSIELDIPITDTITEVKENYKNITSQSIIPQIDNIQKIKNVFYVIGATFILGAITIAIISIKKNNKTPEEIYNNSIKHILKYYSDLIIKVTNEPNISNLHIMRVAVLEDLVDVAEQNQSNIIHYEVIKNKKSNFYVIVDGYVYVYEL